MHGFLNFQPWSFFGFIRRETSLPIRKLALAAGAAGLSNALVLSTVNKAAGALSEDKPTTQNFLIFAVVIVLYVYSQKTLMVTATRGVEHMVHRIRTRLAEKMTASELAGLDKIGRGAVFNSVSRDTQVISQSTLATVVGLQFAILLVFTCIYVAVLSVPAFFLVLGFTIVIGILQVSRHKKLNADLHQAAAAENGVLELINHLLDGFKEIKMSRGRKNDLLEHVATLSEETRDVKTDSLSTMAIFFISSQVSFYALLGIVIFIVPQLSNVFDETITKIATAILFMMGPIQGLAGAIPQIETANAACENIEKIESLLDKTIAKAKQSPASLSDPESLDLAEVRYSYLDEEGNKIFSIGPIDLDLRPAEIVFITGGNGSGKSTLLKLLTSLYQPDDGTLNANGEPISPKHREAYREKLSAVFSDYHLFPRLYGLGHVSDEEVNKWLCYLGLERKTSVTGGVFESLQLSGGQRRRLALLVALLEDRPVMVFDEVAADQDPEFRKRFYTEILPDLKRKGKAVLVITHDDAYFHTSDRLYRMEEGEMSELQQPGGSSA